MAQAITDVKTFLEDARQAVVELAEFEKQEETLAQEEKKRLRVLETERKAVADAVNSTVKKRLIVAFELLDRLIQPDRMPQIKGIANLVDRVKHHRRSRHCIITVADHNIPKHPVFLHHFSPKTKHPAVPFPLSNFIFTVSGCSLRTSLLTILCPVYQLF